MKLRLQHNSIRLRLKRNEVKQIAETGWLEERIVCGADPEQVLTYVLEATEKVTTPCAHLSATAVRVQAPIDIVRRWASGSDIGIDYAYSVGSGEELRILIEKDFACLDGTDEQNFDTFPNPLVGTKC